MECLRVVGKGESKGEGTKKYEREIGMSRLRTKVYLEEEKEVVSDDEKNYGKEKICSSNEAFLDINIFMMKIQQHITLVLGLKPRKT